MGPPIVTVKKPPCHKPEVLISSARLGEPFVNASYAQLADKTIPGSEDKGMELRHTLDIEWPGDDNTVSTKEPKSSCSWLLPTSAAVLFVNNLLFTIPSVFLPRHCKDNLGMSQVEIGWIFGSLSVVSMIVSPPCGWIASKVGARSVTLFGLFVQGVCSLAFGFFDDKWFYIGLRGVMGIGSACTTIGCNVAVAFHCDQNNGEMGKAFGYLEAFASIGLVVGPSLGAGLYDAFKFLWLPFVVNGVLFLACIALVLCTIPGGITEERKGKEWSWAVLLQPNLHVMSWSVLLSSTIGCFIDPCLSLHLESFLGFEHDDPASGSLISSFFLVYAIAYGISSGAAGFLTGKIGCVRCVLLGLMCCTISCILLGPLPVDVLLEMKPTWARWGIQYVGLSLFAVAAAFTLVPTLPYITHTASTYGSAAIATATGIWGFAFSMGESLGPVAGSALVHLVDEYESLRLNGKGDGFAWICTLIAVWSFLLFVISLCFNVREALCVDPPQSLERKPFTVTDMSLDSPLLIPSPVFVEENVHES